MTLGGEGKRDKQYQCCILTLIDIVQLILILYCLLNFRYLKLQNIQIYLKTKYISVEDEDIDYALLFILSAKSSISSSSTITTFFTSPFTSLPLASSPPRLFPARALAFCSSIKVLSSSATLDLFFRDICKTVL